MRILVTGGAGFIGSFLVDELIGRGHEVRVFDALLPQVHGDGGQPAYLNPKAELVHGDVRDREALGAALEGVEWVYHKAGAVGVGQSQYEIKHYVDVNIGGTANLLDLLVSSTNQVRGLVVAASMSSYGEGSYRCEGQKSCGVIRPPLRTLEQMAKREWEPLCPHCGAHLHPIPTDEEAAFHPNSVYAITKQVQEDLVVNFGRTYALPVASFRYFNVYGPRQSLSNPYTGVAAIFLSRLKNDQPPVVYEDGRQTRDFVSVHDVVQANLRALEQDWRGPLVLNIGSGEPRKISGIAETLAQVLGKEIAADVTQTPRKGDVRHCFADISRARETLNFVPQVDFETGMRELIEWSREVEAEDRFDQAAGELKARGLL